AADVRPEAAGAPPAALAAPSLQGRVPPLARAAVRPAVQAAIGDDAGADARADQRDDRVAGAAPRAEPHLGLAERLGAVVDEERDVRRQPRRLAQQGLQRHAVPADRLAVDDGAPGRAAVDDAGGADPDTAQQG